MLTYGNGITSGSATQIGNGYWGDQYQGYPYQDYPSTQTVAYYWPVSTEPTSCIGKAHVFECDHEPKCKCGKVQRVMPKAKAK